MAIELATFLKPKGANTYFLLEDKFIRGGLHSCVNAADRDAINALNRVAGMVAVTQDDKKIWMLDANKTSWSEVILGGGGGGSARLRQTVVHTTASLTPNSSETFTLQMGMSCVLFHCGVSSGPCEAVAHAVPTMDDPNPYTFKALSNHLVDDGTTYLSDGTPILGRRYSVLMNLESTPTNNIYWTVTNKQSVNASIILTLSFLPLE